MQSITFDESRWPLVIVTYAEKVSDSDFANHLRLMEANMCRAQLEGVRSALVYDLTSGYLAPATVRRSQAAWMAHNAHVIRSTCAGVAFVITSTLVRGTLTAILWMSDIPAPYVVTSTVAEADAWCTRRIRLAGAGTQV